MMNVSLEAFVDELTKLSAEPPPARRGPIVEKLRGAGPTDVQYLGGGTMPGSIKAYHAKGYQATPAGLYQATRRSGLRGTREMGGRLRSGQLESRVGRLGGTAAGGLGGFALMRHLVPKSGKLGLLGNVLGATGGAVAGRTLGDLTGQALAHRRLMQGEALRKM